MKFVKTDDLKIGMRIARPIYNKKGVLLYERDSKLNSSSISSIKNFGLIGIYILEPAEPVPPMSEDDIEFERFQTVNVYALEDEISTIINTKKTHKIDILVSTIAKNYGHLNHKINFIQNLRSSEDYVYKHSLNVAMLAAMMCHQMNVQPADEEDTLLACLTHDIGKVMVPKELMMGEDEDEKERILENSQITGFDFLDSIFAAKPNVKRICVQTQQILAQARAGEITEKFKVLTGTRILLVAETYDSMTAMRLSGEPKSEVEALRYLTSNPNVFHPRAVEALVNSINILNTGTCVELNSGERALVISVNPGDILHPMVLLFSTNQIVDLSNRTMYDDMEIVDIMKSMDNRYVMENGVVKDTGSN